MNNLRSFLFTILSISVLLISTTFSNAEEGKNIISDSMEVTTIKVLSWNIHCLPPFAYINGKRKRAREIGKLLAKEDYDVIIFQEAFLHGARRKINKNMKNYPYHIGPANARYITIRTNSGIYMVSRIPIKKVGTVKFREKATSDDKMARKGALMVEFQKNNHTFQVIGTHLNGPDGIKSFSL